MYFCHNRVPTWYCKSSAWQLLWFRWRHTATHNLEVTCLWRQWIAGKLLKSCNVPNAVLVSFDTNHVLITPLITPLFCYMCFTIFISLCTSMHSIIYVDVWMFELQFSLDKCLYFDFDLFWLFCGPLIAHVQTLCRLHKDSVVFCLSYYLMSQIRSHFGHNDANVCSSHFKSHGVNLDPCPLNLWNPQLIWCKQFPKGPLS